VAQCMDQKVTCYNHKTGSIYYSRQIQPMVSTMFLDNWYVRGSAGGSVLWMIVYCKYTSNFPHNMYTERI